MKRHLGVTAIALSLLGCSAQANMQASAGSTKVAQGEGASGAEALQPRESTFDREAREEAETATRYGSPVPNTTVPEAAAPEQSAQQAKSAEPADKAGDRHAKKSQRGRGKSKKHGKNSAGAEVAAVSAEDGADHDRGHGNDLDGVDQDNPGKRKKK